MELSGSLTLGKTIMNSFVDTVLRSKRQGGSGGEQGKDKDKVYSRGGEQGEGAKGSPKIKDKGKKASKGGQAQGKDAEQALAALRRTRAPFIANESVIAAADETTLHIDSEDSVQLLLEELPAQVSAGQLFGHNGWVTGGEAADDADHSGSQVLKSQNLASLNASAKKRQISSKQKQVQRMPSVVVLA